MNTKFLSLVGVLCGATLVGHADTRIGIGLRIGIPAPVIVREAPPPRRVIVERSAPAPAPNYTWVAGHYVWDGRWNWVDGAWVQPPEPGAIWVDGVWNASTQQWIEGHWEIPQPMAAPSQPPPSPPSALGPTTSGEIYVEQGPPPPQHDVRGRSPGRDYVWISGYWGWRGGRHAWVSGHWERPPRRHGVWVDPRWDRRGRGYVFVPGSWR